MEAELHGSNPPESLSVTFLLYYSAIDGAGKNQLVWYRWPLALYSLHGSLIKKADLLVYFISARGWWTRTPVSHENMWRL